MAADVWNRLRACTVGAGTTSRISLEQGLVPHPRHRSSAEIVALASGRRRRSRAVPEASSRAARPRPTQPPAAMAAARQRTECRGPAITQLTLSAIGVRCDSIDPCPITAPNGSRARRRRRRTAWVIGAVVLLAVGALALGIAAVGFRTARRHRTAPAPPPFVDDTSEAGIDHVYDGEFEFFVGRRRGGRSTATTTDAPSCTSQAAASRLRCIATRARSVGALRFAQQRFAGHRPDRRHRRLPARHRQRSTTRPRRPAARRNVVLRGLGDCRFEQANDLFGIDGGELDDRLQRHVGGFEHAADAGVRQLPDARRRFQRHSCDDSQLVPTGYDGRRLRRRRYRCVPATARCRCCSATGAGPADAICG